jgi:ribosomal protein L35
MKLKTKKALRKRIRLTSGKKIMIRAGGQDHFNSREGGKTTRNKRRDKTIANVNVRAVKQLLPYL